MSAIQRAAIAAMPVALLFSCAADAQSPIRAAAPAAAPQKPKSHHSFTDIFNGTVGRVLGVQIIPPRYWYKADHSHAGLTPHYHTWEMQRRWSTANKECYWRYRGGKVGVGTFSRPPDGVAPCSTFPDFTR